jgi:hypothetical protein
MQVTIYIQDEKFSSDTVAAKVETQFEYENNSIGIKRSDWKLSN